MPGAKFVVYEATDRADYQRRIRDHYAAEFPMEAVAPACARKLIEAAAASALHLGFAPHRDFRKAARVFGGIAPADCSQDFAFRQDGKPFYRRGPRETVAEARRIVEHLTRRCGPDNFDYLVRLGE